MATRWAAHNLDQAVHVVPIDDLIEHDTTGTDCICGPTLTIGEDGVIWAAPVVTHNSLDGRELSEPDYEPKP